MATENFDLVVIGGGPGGYVAAIRASQLGLKVALIEREHLGGICLNWGCIPSKALLRSAEINELLSRLNEFGFSAENIKFDSNQIIKRSRKIASQLAKGVEYLLKKNKVKVISGFGKISAPNRVEVKGTNGTIVINALHIVLATGARPKLLPSVAINDPNIWTYKEAMVPNKVPESLVIIGSGAIGVEFASFYSDMGSSVTLIETLGSILPAEDAEISNLAQNLFQKSGIKIHVSTNVKELQTKSGSVATSIEKSDGQKISLNTEKAIVAIGIVGNTEGLGLEDTKILINNGHLEVNQWMETPEPHIYAIGDLVGPPWLAHKASHEAILCVEKIAGSGEVLPLQNNRIPGCTYSRPQIASVGLSEDKAKQEGKKIKVGRFPFRGNGKAISLGESEGLIKTIFDSGTGELLGAHMIGPEVTELIQGFVIAMGLECTEEDLIRTVFPHPTLSEIMHESVLAAYDKAIHI
jgi:dihydrolipoamide dehydrogenase